AQAGRRVCTPYAGLGERHASEGLMSLIREYRALWLVVALVMSACANDTPDNTLRVSGHVEATEVHVASEVGGRILELRVDEGARLNQGDVIAQLDTRDTALQIQRGRADREGAVAQLRLLEAGSRGEDIPAADERVAGAGGGV